MNPALRHAITATVIAAIFVSAAPAQQPRKTVIKNTTVSASARINTPPYVGSLDVFQGTGTGVNVGAFIRLDLCSFHPDHEHRYCVYLDGTAPASAISANAELVTFDAPDINVQNGAVIDCRTGVCMGGPLPSPVSFRGTWKKYTGPYSFEGENLGIFKNTGRFPDTTITSIVAGISRGTSADFDGTFGTILLQTPGRESQAAISQSRNLNIEITRTGP